MPAFTEDQMADVVLAHTEELLGEHLTLVARKHWIGRYELDLLFHDRHGATLIVELQRGALDRYHLYKVLDYYDEYKDRNREQFVEVMVIANLITAERKARLAARGVEFREIPEEVFHRYLAAAERPSQPIPALQHSDGSVAQSNEATPQRDPIAAIVSYEEHLRTVPELPELPGWFLLRLARLNPKLQGHMRTMIRIYPPRDEHDWVVHAAAMEYMQAWAAAPAPTQYQPERLFDGSGALSHFYCHFRDLDNDSVESAAQFIADELKPLLRLSIVAQRTTPRDFFSERSALISALAAQAGLDPPFLLRLCSSLHSLWRSSASITSDQARTILVFVLTSCLTDIVKEVSLKVGGSRRIPVGVDDAGAYVMRDVKLRWHKTPVALFRHLTGVLAITTPAIVKLWRERDALSTFSDVDEWSLPVVERPFQVGADLLVNAYGSRVYTVDTPSEVALDVGDIKTITLLESARQGCAYKIRYRDETVSFGLVGLRGVESDDLLCDYFSTASLVNYVFQPTMTKGATVVRVLHAPPDVAGGQEFSLVAALVRDFFVCEERERFYQPELRPSARGGKKKRSPDLVVRYLPRFKVHYVGMREPEYRQRRVDVTGHHVCGHLRRCRIASPFQKTLAKEFDIDVPYGFTFVRPHDRGGHVKVLYRSRSALQLVYGSGQRQVVDAGRI